METKYVAVSELVVGRVYGRSTHRYVYLGRNDKNEFCWLDVDSDAAVQNIVYLSQRVERYCRTMLRVTKHNRKILKGFREDVDVNLSKLSTGAKLAIRVVCRVKIV